MFYNIIIDYTLLISKKKSSIQTLQSPDLFLSMIDLGQQVDFISSFAE